MSNKYKHIQSGKEYEKYFSKPTGKNEDIKRNSKLQDTIEFLPIGIARSQWQVKDFCRTLKSRNAEGICAELWDWIYTHIRYNQDVNGKEQIRSPRRSFFDREAGVDCDDYTVFISCVLCEFKIPHTLRIAKYKEQNGFQHIYPIVPLEDGSYITMDCVADSFDYEVPFIETIDKAMDLQFLDGIDDETSSIQISGIDAEDLLSGYEDMGELGKRLKDTKIAKKVGGAVKKTVQKVTQSKVYNQIRKGVHAVNRVNPATALLRAGILASLKLNVFKVAETLRYGYLSNQQAQAKGFDMEKFNRLVGVKNRLQKIFYGAGGKEENFKNAILTGKGNQNKEVLAGLNAIDQNEYTLNDDLSQILGIESYDSEMQGVEGIEGLGEPATGAAIAAATSVMTAIAGLLKGIGSLRKKKQEEAKSNSEKSNGNEERASTDRPSTEAPSNETPTTETPFVETSQNQSTQDTSVNAKDGQDNSSGSNTTETNSETSNTTDANSSSTTSDDNAVTQSARAEANTSAKVTETGMSKVKTWVKANPVATGAIAVVAVSLVTWAIIAYSGKNEKKKKSEGSLGGFSKKKKHKKHKHHSNKHQHIKIQKLR